MPALLNQATPDVHSLKGSLSYSHDSTFVVAIHYHKLIMASNIGGGKKLVRHPYYLLAYCFLNNNIFVWACPTDERCPRWPLLASDMYKIHFRSRWESLRRSPTEPLVVCGEGDTFCHRKSTFSYCTSCMNFV